MPESKMWSVALGLGLVLLGRSAWAIPPTTSVFNLKPNPKFVKCLQLGSATPFAQVTVTQNTLNDDLAILVRNVKPNLAFDLFTIQNTNLLPNGTVDPNFLNFGLAWYQSDIETDSFGNALTVICSIFVNQIFGFDPEVSLPRPTPSMLDSGSTTPTTPRHAASIQPNRRRSTVSTMLVRMQ